MASNVSIKTKKQVLLKKIFTQYNYNDSMWLDLIKKNYEPEAQFLYLLAPCITYINEKIGNIKLKNYQINEDNRQNIILRRFKEYWLQKIIMCCVLEMNDAKELKLLEGETPEKRFVSFIKILADTNNRTAFFDKYIVLKEKIKRYIIKEIEAITEILIHLDKCFSEILSTFSWKKDKYTLRYIQSSGDSHGSKNVCILVLKNSINEIYRIVYKPRSLLIDRAYSRFLEWLNLSLKYPLYSPKLLLKKNYGWYEFISNTHCRNEKEIKEYYQNLGNLLAVVYLLCGSDIHYENIIAYGKSPVIIDVECFFVPRQILKNNPIFFQDKTYSVLNTLMLPGRFMIKSGTKGMDISSFTNHANQEVPYQAIVAEESGTDNVRLIRKTIMSSKQNNVPYTLKKKINPIEYDKEFIAGFSEAYSIFLDMKEYLLSKESPLLSFKKARTRLVFRPTSEYVKLIVESYHPLLLHDNYAYKKHFFSWIAEKKILGFLKKTEIQQVLQGDVPAYYSMISLKTKIEDANFNSLKLKFVTSGYEQVLYHVKNNINKNDLKSQVNFIKQSFVCHRINSKELKSKNFISQIKNITQKNILNNAHAILKEILDNVWIREDLLFWPQAYSTYETWNIGVTTPWMYDGLVGITLVFGVASQIIFKNNKYDQFTMKCLKAIEMYISELRGKKNYLPVGAFSGVGGVLYLIQILSTCKIKYDFNILKKQCFLMLEQYLPNMKINSIGNLDIISGVSGLLKILVNFKDTEDEKQAFKLAHICVKHILFTYPDPSKFSVNMLNNNNLKKPLLGFSHGVSGIAWALYNYHIFIKKNKKIYDWIQKALAYERENFSKKHQNWPHLGELISTQDLDASFPVKWCHGAVGIGFSRIDMYCKGWRDEYILNEIKTAVEKVIATAPTRHLNLCHGTLGNLEFLTFAMDNNFLTSEQYNTYFNSIIPYIRNPKKMVSENHEQLFLTGLMTGKAGVVYGLLKIAHPDLTSILLLDKIKK